MEKEKFISGMKGKCLLLPFTREDTIPPEIERAKEGKVENNRVENKAMIISIM